MSARLVLVWILGGLFILGGIWILQNLEMNLGVGEFQYALAMIIAFVLVLLAGLCWISVAVATRQEIS
jgi:hypothetical protein